MAFKGSKAAAVFFFLFTVRVFANDVSSTDESNNQSLMLVVFVLFFFLFTNGCYFSLLAIFCMVKEV